MTPLTTWIIIGLLGIITILLYFICSVVWAGYEPFQPYFRCFRNIEENTDKINDNIKALEQVTYSLGSIEELLQGISDNQSGLS